MKSLNTALIAAQRQIAPVEKDGWNSHGGYAYASNEAIVSASRAVLIEHGLVPYSEMVSFEVINEVATKSGQAKVYLLKMAFELYHAESGESRKSTYFAEARSNNDKALLAAITVCQREYLRQLLLIPRGGVDPESVDEGHASQRQQQPQRQQQRPQQRPQQQPQRPQQQRQQQQQPQPRQQQTQKQQQPQQQQQHAEKVYPNGPGDVGSYKPGPDEVPLDKDQLSRLATEAARKLTARGMTNAIDRIRSVLTEVKQRTGKPLTGNHVKAAEQKLHMELDKEVK